MNDKLKGFIAGVGTCLTLIIGVAASPTDSAVRSYLRGLVDSTAAPPPLVQATNGVFAAGYIATANVGTATVTNGTIVALSNTTLLSATGNVAQLASGSGTITNLIVGTLTNSNPVLTTNTFTFHTNTFTIIIDANGTIKSITSAAL